MKPTKAQRAEVQKLIERWRPRLYLNEWHVDIVYMKDSAKPDPSSVGGGQTLAAIQPDPVYLQARIEIYPEFWAEPPWQREKALVHELAHCLTQELFDLVRALWRDETVSQRDARERLERLTQRITHIAIYQQGAR